MPQALGVLALALFQMGAPIWLANAIVGLGTFLGTGLGQLLLAAGALGLQFALQKKPSTPQPSDIQSNIRQEISARRRIYGRYLTGSVIVFGFRRGEKSYLLHYICEGPINGYVSFRLDKKPVTLDVDGFVQEDQYIVKGRSRVQILTTLGTMTDEPFAELIAAFPELDDPLAPFRHRGCAMVLQIVEQVPEKDLQDTYPNNMPSLQVVVDGWDEVYDPRTETYGFTDNSGAVLLTEIFDVYGLDHTSAEDVDFDSFATFADECDVAVGTKSGPTEPRYRTAGLLQLDAENEDRIKAIAMSCNADVYLDGQGRFAVRQKIRTTPGFALRAKNGDHLSIQMEGGRSLQKLYNTAKVTYVDPLLNYKANEISWRHPDLYEEDGDEFTATAQILLCPSSTQAQRLAKLLLHEGNPEFIGQLTSGPQALDLLNDFCFTLDLSPEEAFERVASATEGIQYDGENMTVTASFLVFREGATAWDPLIDEQDSVVVPPDLPSDVDDVLLDVTVNVEIQNNSAPVLKFSWVASGAETLPDSYSQDIEVSPADADEWTAASVNQDDDTAVFGPVADGAAYDWRIRNRTGGRTFDWQNSTTPVTVVVDQTAPLALTSFALAASAPHLGHAPLAMTTANDSHLRLVKIFRKASGVALDLGVDTPIVQLSVGPLSTYSYIDGDATRVTLLSNGDFASDTVWTKGAGWAIAAGNATKTAGVLSALSQAVSMTAGDVMRIGFDVSGRTAGAVTAGLTGSPDVSGTGKTTNATFLESLTANATSSSLRFLADATFDGSIDNVSAYKQTASCVPQGTWDYYAVPFNVSGIDGPPSGPVTVTII